MIKMELHAHTKMSEMKGLIDPLEMVDVAIDRGYEVLAVTDCGSLQAFPEIFYAVNKAEREGKALHVIYGVEGYLRRGAEKGSEDSGKCYPILIYVRNRAGLMNLYKLVSRMHRDSSEPWIDTKELQSLREGLLIGAVCENGELAEAILSRKDEAEIKEAVSFYDFIEITPYCEKETEISSELFLAGRESGIPVIFSSDAYYISPDHKICYEILQRARGAAEKTYRRPAHLKDTTDFDHIVSVISEEIVGVSHTEVREYILGSMKKLAAMTAKVTQLIKIAGLMHGTGVWRDNAENLIGEGIVGLDDCIGNRDDIMQYLEAMGFDHDKAFVIMESVRKGRGLSEQYLSEMHERNIPDWYIDSCAQIKYLFPKAHAATYIKMALIIAWYKVYYPDAYKKAYRNRTGTN